jgi:hypothetical protein
MLSNITIYFRKSIQTRKEKKAGGRGVVRDVNLRMLGVRYTHSVLEFQRSEK